MGFDSFAYKLFFLLHLGAVVVGFGSSFVYPLIGSKARKLGAEAPKEAYAIAHAGFEASKVLTTPVIYAAGVLGIILVPLSGEFGWKFSQTWVSAAFVLFIGAALLAAFVHVPNLKAMDALQEKLANGNATPNPNGPPKEVVELEERGGRAGMYGGILHLLWLVLMIDMIWKPGL